MTTAAKRRQQKIAEKAARKTARKKPGGGQLERRQQLVLQQSLDLAVQHHKAGDLRKAERIYNQILQADPNQPVALHLLGAIAHQVGKDDIAIELITKAVARKPDYAEAHYNLCYVLEKANRTEAFREAVGRARRDCPGHPRLSRGEALLLKWDGDFVAARALLEATGEEVADARFLKERARICSGNCATGWVIPKRHSTILRKGTAGTETSLRRNLLPGRFTWSGSKFFQNDSCLSVTLRLWGGMFSICSA